MSFLSFLPLIGGAISAIGDVFGSHESANAQAQAQREANATNLQIAREQMAYQTSEREATQAYNTPLNQRLRYQQAGINPYMMLSGMNAGNTEMQSAVSTHPVQPVVDNALGASLSAAGRSVASGVDAFYRQQQLQNQADSIGLDNRLKAITLANEGQRQLLELESKRAEIANSRMDVAEKQKRLESLDEQIENLRTNNAYLSDFLSARNDTQREEANVRRSEIQLNKAKTVYQNKMNKVFDKLNALQIRQMKAAIDETYSRINLNSKMSEKTIKETAKLVTEEQTERARKFGIDIDNTWKADMYGANLNYIETTTHKVHNTDNVVQNWLAPFASSVGAGAIGAALLK